MEALRLILEGIDANQVRQAHALRSMAKSMGFLASKCYRKAGKNRREAITGVALPAIESEVRASDLLRRIEALAEKPTDLDRWNQHGTLVKV